MHGLGADAQAIIVALERHFLVAAARKQLRVNAELLRPIARNPAAHGENSHALGREHGFGEIFEVVEGVEAQLRTSFLAALALMQRKIDADFGIGERRNENGNILFRGGFQDAAPSAC